MVRWAHCGPVTGPEHTPVGLWPPPRSVGGPDCRATTSRKDHAALVKEGTGEHGGGLREVGPVATVRQSEWRRLVAEGVGMFFLVLVAAGAEVADAVTGGGTGRSAAAVAPGVTVLALIYTLGETSGAHFNPAVSASMNPARSLAPALAWGLRGPPSPMATLAAQGTDAEHGRGDAWTAIPRSTTRVLTVPPPNRAATANRADGPKGMRTRAGSDRSGGNASRQLSGESGGWRPGPSISPTCRWRCHGTPDPG